MGTVPGRRMDMTFKQLYAWYIGSETWKALREVRLKRDKRKCQRCGTTEQLHVHHLTYERFTREALADLITVCEDCHDYIHRQARENPRLTLEEVTRRAVRELGKGRAARKPRQPRRPRREPAVTVGRNERCWCGELFRLGHKHKPGGGGGKGALPWETPQRDQRHEAQRPREEYRWVCTRKDGWQRERVT